MTDQRPPTVTGGPKPAPVVSNPKAAPRKPGALPIAVGGAVIAAAMALIAPWEGSSLKPYRDIVGVWTVCYGHADTSGAPVDRTKTYTPAECKELLATDTGKAFSHVARCVPLDLPTPTLAAFTSAAFNIGPSVVCGSTLQVKAKAHDVRGACAQLLRWTRAGGQVVRGLVNRRKAEYQVCMEGAK